MQRSVVVPLTITDTPPKNVEQGPGNHDEIGLAGITRLSGRFWDAETTGVKLIQGIDPAKPQLVSGHGRIKESPTGCKRLAGHGPSLHLSLDRRIERQHLCASELGELQKPVLQCKTFRTHFCLRQFPP
jgi:hypothetical protein